MMITFIIRLISKFLVILFLDIWNMYFQFYQYVIIMDITENIHAYFIKLLQNHYMINDIIQNESNITFVSYS
jgi:hypothetical protein